MQDHRALRRAVRALYRGLPLRDRLFALARATILAFPDLLPLLPREGRLLDLGCGPGVLTNVLALAHPGLQILGVDLDPHLIAVARHTIRGRENLAFEVGDALALRPRGPYDAVVCFDLLHHLPGEVHRRVLEAIRPLLRPGGTLVLKEIDVRPRWKYFWNYLHDTLVTRGQPLAFCASPDLIRLVGEAGYARVALHAIRSPFPYPEYAVTARRGDGSRNGGDP